MTRLPTLSLILLPILFLAVGCGSPEQKLIGTWEGRLALNESATPPPAGNPLAAAAQAAMKASMENMVANLRPIYVFNADKTFEMDMPSPLGNVKSTGTWEVFDSSGNAMTVRLNPTNNPTFERPITFTDADHFETANEHGVLKFERKVNS